MAINVFEGGRRIAKLLAIIWVVGLVATVGYRLADYEPAIFVSFTVNPSGEFERIPEKCPSDHFSTIPEMFVTKGGIKFFVDLCRPNRLKNTLYYLSIDKFEKAKLTEFIRNSDTQWVVDQKNKRILNNMGRAIAILFAGLLVIWVFTWATGWIVRGFMGIPRGQDKKE